MSSNKADHRADLAALVRQLDRAGKPRWADTLNVSDVFHNDELTLAEKRAHIVDRIKNMSWYKKQDENSDLHDVIDRISCVEDADEFDDCWDEVYDLADWDRIWIQTHGR